MAVPGAESVLCSWCPFWLGQRISPGIGDYHRFPVSNGYGWSQGKSFLRLDAQNILQENDKQMGPQKALLSRCLHNSVAAMRRFWSRSFLRELRDTGYSKSHRHCQSGITSHVRNFPVASAREYRWIRTLCDQPNREELEMVGR